MTALFFLFLIFTYDKANTFDVSKLDSSIRRALAKTPSSLAIFASCKPCASFAASYSAFSDKSPLSLASAMALAIFDRPSVLIYFHLNNLFPPSNETRMSLLIPLLASASTHAPSKKIKKRQDHTVLPGQHGLARYLLR